MEQQLTLYCPRTEDGRHIPDGWNEVGCREVTCALCGVSFIAQYTQYPPVENLDA